MLRGGADANSGKTAGQDAEQGSDGERASHGRAVRKNQLLALGVPVLGLAMWFAQENGHGLVSAYGFALGALAWAAFRAVLRPDRDLRQPPRTTVASLTGLDGRRGRSAD